MKLVTPDFERMSRCGIPEVVYGKSKDSESLVGIAKRFLSRSGRVIITKLDGAKAKKVASKFKGAKHRTKLNSRAGTLVIKDWKFKIRKVGTVGIITAGTSDIPVAEEAKVIAEELGCEAITGYDVGVAGIHRLYPVLKSMEKASVIIVAAGMEGALPSVVSGLVDVPVIGVPTSVGYGVGEGGKAALYTMLNSCTPVAVVNIDNGYGAAVLAYQILRMSNGESR